MPLDTWLAGWRPYALLGALCLCLYLPGIAALPVLDRDEARFAQATRQMLESRDFLDIRFRDEARNNKPAGIYWLQAAAVAALSTPRSTAIWPYRVPSLIGATLAAMLTFALGRRLLDDKRPALLAAMLLAAALGTLAEAHIAKTDAALLAATAAGQGALGLAYVRARGGARAGPCTIALFWLAEIAAIYLKGPVGPGLALVTAASLSLADRDARWLRALHPAAGLTVTALAVAPWLYAIEHATAGRFLGQAVGHDLLAKITGGQEAHGAPPLYYLGLAFVTFWPGSWLIAPAVLGGWRRRAEPARRFLLAWLIPAWIALELVPTKLPHYALPLYPALALLAAASLVDGVDLGRWGRWLVRANRLLWLAVTLAIAVAWIVLPVRLGSGAMPAGIAGTVLILALAALFLWQRLRPLRATALLAAMSVVLAIAGSFIVPALDRLWLSRGAAALATAHPPPNGSLTVVGYNEPSLVFLLNGSFKTQTADVPVPAGGEALVSSRDTAAFEQAEAASGLAAQAIDAVPGIDYSNGQHLTLTLYRIVPR
ncbi:MAG TPA: glycosyl transferase [Stellaceae bacterium]|nr:glycosyl transferase [Stellaceae bacterium]